MSLQRPYGFRNLSGWERFGLVGREVSASNLLHLAMAMAMVSFRYFLRSCHRPIRVRYNCNVFARKMHSTSEFAMIVLSKCVIHAGFVTVAWALRGIPFQVGEWILDLISEFTIFNLVIRLSKVKELAIFRFSPSRLSTCWTIARCSRDSPFLNAYIGCSLKPRQHFSWLLLESLTDRCNMRTPGTGHACRYGDSSFYGRWYGSNVHVIRGLIT